MKLSKVFDEVVAICEWFWPSLLCTVAAIGAYCLGMVDVADTALGMFPVIVVINIVMVSLGPSWGP